MPNQLKNSIHILWQRKELVAIYCFEEYLCNVFLSTEALSQNQVVNWADYLALAPYCFLLLVGLGFAQSTRRKTEKMATNSNTTWQAIVGEIQKLQKRFPVAMALVSIALVLTGEILEQQLLEILQSVCTIGNSAFALIIFLLAILITLLIDLILCFPLMLTVVVFFSDCSAEYFPDKTRGSSTIGFFFYSYLYQPYSFSKSP